MIDRCFNPDCRRKLHYLRDGRVVRLITGKGEDEVIEHYWLCGPCNEEYNFVFPAEGGVALEAKPGGKQSNEFHRAEAVIDTEPMKQSRQPEHEEAPVEDAASNELGKRS